MEAEPQFVKTCSNCNRKYCGTKCPNCGGKMRNVFRETTLVVNIAKLPAQFRITDCPKCGARTFFIRKNGGQCTTCKHEVKADPIKLAAREIRKDRERAKLGIEWPIRDIVRQEKRYLKMIAFYNNKLRKLRRKLKRERKKLRERVLHVSGV